MIPIPLDELIDIVDQHDRVIETRWRSQANLVTSGNYARTVGVILVDRLGFFCIGRRSVYVKMPHKLSIVGGVVQSGETYQDAARRELFEEASFDIGNDRFRFFGVIPPTKKHPFFCGLFEVRVPDRCYITLRSYDFSQTFWLTYDELQQQESEHVFPHNLQQIFKKFYR